MCSTDVYCSKQTGSSSTKGNHHSSFLRFWNWAGRNFVDAAKICGGAENVVKTETQQTFVNGLPWFYYFSIYTPAGSACVLLITIVSRLMIWATPSALLINILRVLPVVFAISLSEGEISQPSGSVCQSGRPYYPREAVLHTDRQTALMCNRRRPAATSSRRVITFSFSIS